MATARRTAAPKTRTLLVFDQNGRFKITIPATAKVTFGGFNQGKYPDGTAALRIYVNATQQLACFRGVTGFFDVDLPIEREVVTETGESAWTSGPEGYSETKKVNRKAEFQPFDN